MTHSAGPRSIGSNAGANRDAHLLGPGAALAGGGSTRFKVIEVTHERDRS